MTETTTTQTPTRECGKKYTRPVGKNKTMKEFTCNKPAGHDKKVGDKAGTPHGRTTNVRPVQVSDSALDSFEFSPTSEVVTLATRERDAKQQKIDGHVMQAYQAWVAAGKPKLDKDSPQVRYAVDPGEVEDMVKIIRRGADFHGKRAQIGPPTPVLGQDDDGNPTGPTGKLWLHYRVIDKPAASTPSEMRQNANADTAQATPAGAAS